MTVERAMKWLGIMLTLAAIASGVARGQQLPIVLNGGQWLSLGTNAAVVGWSDPNTYSALYEMETTNTTAILDTSGNNISLTNKAASWPTWAIIGTNQNARVEHGFNLDGSSHYFQGAKILNTATSWTWFAWVCRTGAVAYGGIALEPHVGYGAASGLLMDSLGTRARAEVTSASAYHFANGNTTLTNGVWYFVWSRWKGSNPVELYINSGLDATSAGNTIISTASDQGAAIGRYFFGSRYFPGLIDGAGVFVNGSTGYADTNTMQQIMLNTHPTNNVRIRP
jgi:hypothetical protein